MNTAPDMTIKRFAVEIARVQGGERSLVYRTVVEADSHFGAARTVAGRLEYGPDRVVLGPEQELMITVSPVSAGAK